MIRIRVVDPSEIKLRCIEESWYCATRDISFLLSASGRADGAFYL